MSVAVIGSLEGVERAGLSCLLDGETGAGVELLAVFGAHGF